jgi:hypothetical protein
MEDTCKTEQRALWFEVLAAVKMSIVAFWLLTPCGLADRNQHFGGTYYLQVFRSP